MEDLIKTRISELESKISNYDPHYNGSIETLVGWQIRLDELKSLVKGLK